MSPPIQPLHHYAAVHEAYEALHNVCSRIYIARNIVCDPEMLENELKKIDKIFCTPSWREE